MENFKFFKKLSLIMALAFILTSTQALAVDGNEEQKEKKGEKVKTVF